MDIEAFLILLQIILIPKEKQKPVQGKNTNNIFSQNNQQNTNNNMQQQKPNNSI